MSMGVFVVDSSDDQIQSRCKAILGYDNMLINSIPSGNGYDYEDPDYPLSLALDYSYFTEYSVDIEERPTSAVLVFTPTSIKQADYFMLISKNAEECELSVTVEIFDSDEGDYVEVSGFGSMTNGLPVMVYFGDDFDNGYVNASAARITLNYTSKPYIMSMMCGKARVFDRTFSIGFQPAKSAYLDEVRQFDAEEGLNVVIGRRLARGKQLRGSINYILMTTVDDFWDDYANHVLDSKPICIMWNNLKPSEVIYGIQNVQRLTKPQYKTSMFTQIDFEVAGWA